MLYFYTFSMIHEAARWQAHFLQVSKLFEVVPPILLAGGKVSVTVNTPNITLVELKPLHTFLFSVKDFWNLCTYGQVKNPWPNAHSGVLLQYYGLKEQKRVTTAAIFLNYHLDSLMIRHAFRFHWTGRVILCGHLKVWYVLGWLILSTILCFSEYHVLWASSLRLTMC